MPTSVKDKCITFFSHNGLLCHNVDESQEKKMLREEANNTFIFIFIFFILFYFYFFLNFILFLNFT